MIVAPHGLKSNAGYADEAADLLVRYEAATFEESYAGMLHLLPAGVVRAIDIGAGTGRDAAALAARGHEVLAVEPTSALRDGAMAIHPDPHIRWLDDSLPRLSRIGSNEGVFDLALVMAVWMHLDADERRRGLLRLAELLAPEGRLLLTLRYGPVPRGRRMFNVSAAETIALAEAANLRLIYRDEVESRGPENVRAGVRWTRLAFKHI